MNKNVSNNPRLYVDRPLLGKVARQGRVSTLRLLSTEDSDLADATMRVFLLLCLLSSLALCGLRMNSGNQAVEEGSGRLTPTWTRGVPHAPSLPAVQLGASLR